MSKSWANGSTSRWRKIRRVILERDKWMCQQCGRPLDPKLKPPHPGSATVHHALGRTMTGDENMRYLEACCRACNLQIGDPAAGPDPQPKRITRW